MHFDKKNRRPEDGHKQEMMVPLDHRPNGIHYHSIIIISITKVCSELSHDLRNIFENTVDIVGAVTVSSFLLWFRRWYRFLCFEYI